MSAPGLHNPNWKGPIPLYPDELNTIIKQAAFETPKEDVAYNANENAKFSDKVGSEIGDLEYMEDYMNNKYDRLAKMAQAYSDYGVLNEKKDTNPKNEAMPNSKVMNDQSREKLSLKEMGHDLLDKQSFIERPKKGKLRVELKLVVKVTILEAKMLFTNCYCVHFK